MIRKPEMLGNEWKEQLDLHNRKAPDLFEFSDKVVGTPYSAAIRTGFDELGLSAFFCVNGVPTIALRRTETYDLSEVINIHAALWNQGLASVLVIISDSIVRVFSLAKTPYAGDDSGFEDRCLIDAIDATTAVMRLQSLITGAETGRLWREKQKYFKHEERIDAVLLNNLEHTHQLLSSDGLSSDQAQAILIQTMFIAYLEDRKIVGDEYFRKITEKEYGSLSGILNSGSVPALENLFRKLRRDFNGDLFVAPCSFSESAPTVKLSHHHMTMLERFRHGREEIKSNGSQLRFWGYDFRFIPVELISAVYDRFLGKDMDSRRSKGAFYTPMFLADCVVASTWDSMTDTHKENAIFLDPACGSGVFLVRSFQRMCDHWRETRSQKTIRWDSLKKMIARIHGRDVNSGAVRVAVFSLYLALLEQISPPDLLRLIDEGRLLPPLWNQTLIASDFFDIEPSDLKVDVIIGNPPWTSRKGDTRNAIQWALKYGYPAPSGEEAWSFTWKGLLHLKEDGLLAYLLPAMGFLNNNADASVTARVRLFEDAKVRKVINFSDLRFQLFDGAIRPAALFMMTNTIQKKATYEFDYWTPKADMNLAIKRFVTLSSADKSTLFSDEVASNELLFKHKLWMRPPEAKLFRYLSSLPKLGQLIVSSRKSKDDEGWSIGRGFEPFNNTASSSSFVESDYVGELPYVSIQEYKPLTLTNSGFKPWRSNRVRRRGFEKSYLSTKILVPRGVQTSSWRLRASYTTEDLTFQDIIQSIKVPMGKEKEAKLITALINSRLAVWFAFHGTAYFGSERPEVKQTELMRLPYPSPSDLSDPASAEAAFDKLVSLIDQSSQNDKKLLSSEGEQCRILREIDFLVYEYFGLTSDEILLIEDAVNYTFPAVQPNSGTYPEIWKPANKEQRREYAETLVRRLSSWFNDETKVEVNLVAKNLDFAILRLSLKQTNNCEEYFERDGVAFTDALSRLSESIGQPLNENFVLLPDIRIFQGNNLFLIKPLQMRFWLGSTALADADGLAVDLETVSHTDNMIGIAS